MWIAEPSSGVVRTMTDAAAHMLPRLGIFSLQSAIVLTGISSVAYLLRHRSASVRHRLWSVGLGGVLALPVFTLCAAEWHMAAFPNAEIWVALLHWLQYTKSGGLSALSGWGDALGPHTWIATAGVFIILAWIAGMLVMAARIVIGIFGVRRLARHAVPLTDAEWARLIHRSSNQLGIRRPITVLLSRYQNIPIVWGLIRPTVLLPVSAHDWTEAQRAAVLMHEFAHIRRLDALVQMIVHLTSTIFWFHPWIWNAVQHIRIECERACDDLVLLAGTSPVSYANHLVCVARLSQSDAFTPPMALGTLAMARPTGLETRVLSILNPKVDRRPLNKREIATIVMVVALMIFPTAVLRPAPSVQTNATGGTGQSQDDYRSRKAGPTPSSRRRAGDSCPPTPPRNVGKETKPGKRSAT